jgi:cyclomaltodextrin glucanotransferase
MVLSNAENTQTNSSEVTAIKAAAGFHTTEETKSFDADFEFLFTRSIEFRQETIYFLIVDRFNDGDTSNNAGPNPELYDPTRQKWGRYWGGGYSGNY